MSQRLHIGETKDPGYDCVITEYQSNAKSWLLSEWIRCDWWGGPYKIRIGDMALFKRIEPIVAEVLKKVRMKYPEDVWAFYFGNESIEHPTASELSEWLKGK